MSGKDWHAVNVLNEDGKFTTSGQNDQIVGASSDVLDERVMKYASGSHDMLMSPEFLSEHSVFF